MRAIISRWFLFGLLLGWALTHATVFGQTTAEKIAANNAGKVRVNLDKSVTLDYTGQSLTEVLNHFRDKTGVAISIDQMSMMQMGMDAGGIVNGFPGGAGPAPGGGQVHLKVSNEKASQVLRKLLNVHQLTYILFEDSVLVTTAEMAMGRQMRQRVSVDLDEVPFNKAVRHLAKTHGLNLVIDPKVKMQAETPVSLQLENTGIETTVRLMAELASLKAVRMGNVTLITTDEKAKRIRDEEPQQFDNLLNPNAPGVPPMMRGGFGFGGMGGVMPMPARAVPAIPLQVPPGGRSGGNPAPVPPGPPTAPPMVDRPADPSAPRQHD